MNVRDLRESLTGFDDEMLVVLSKDGEGNGFSPLADVERAVYIPDSTWSGEISDDPDYEPDDNDIPAVVLWPTN